MNALAVRQELAVLTEASAALADAGLDLPVLLDTITDLLATHVSDLALVYLLNDDGVTVELASLASDEPELLEAALATLSGRARRMDDPGPIGTCFATRSSVLANDVDPVQLRAQLPESYLDLVDRYRTPRSLLYVPLLSGGVPFGVVAVARDRNPEPFDEDEVELVCDVVELASPSILNAQLHQRLAEMTALFETAFSHAPIGMAIHTVGPGPSSFIRVNDTLAQILGRTEAELLGRPVSDLVDPSDRDEVDELLALVAAGELLEHSDDMLLTRGDGATVAVWVDSRAVRLEPETLLLLTQVQPLGQR